MFELFLRFAHEARRAGCRRLSAREIGERIRWYANVDVKRQPDARGQLGPKLNNNFFPYYSRLAMLTDRKLAGLFERRDARFDASDEEILQAAKRA